MRASFPRRCGASSAATSMCADVDWHPKDSVLRYETALKVNQFVVMMHGDSQGLARAREVLKSAGMSSLPSEVVAAAHA
jgi:hypothetical protein